METGKSKQQIEFAERLMQLVNMENMARKVLNLAIAVGNEEMQISARDTLRRASEQVAALVVSPASN